MDPVSVVAGGVAFATAIKDIISLGLKLRECLQNAKQNMNELGMLSQELVSDMYRLQALYDDVSVIDSSQSDHLLYELDGVKLSLERVLKKCQNLAVGKSMGFLLLWSEWNFRRTLENELPRLRRQVDNIRLHFVFHSNIRLERALLVQPTEHSALLQRSQTALAALLSDPDSEYCQSIVTEMDNDVQMGFESSVAVQYLKLQIMSLWKMAEGLLSNASTMTVRPRWDPLSSDPQYLKYLSPTSIKRLSQEVLSLFVGLSSGTCSDVRQLLNDLSIIATRIVHLQINRPLPKLMGRVEETAKQVALSQRGFTVDHAYFIFLLSYHFSTSEDMEAAFEWSQKGLMVLDTARVTGLWTGENTNHLSAELHLLHGNNCLKSPQWIIHAGHHFTEAQKICRELVKSSSSDCSVPPIVRHDWLNATVHLIEYHLRVDQPQQALYEILGGLNYFLHIDNEDVDDISASIVSQLNFKIQNALRTLKGHNIPVTAVHEVLTLSKKLSRSHAHLFGSLFLSLLMYDTAANYFLAQDLKAPSDQQLRLMQAFIGARLADADSCCLDGQLRRALSSSIELQGEDHVFDIFFAYLFSSDYEMDGAAQSFFLDIIAQLAIHVPSLMQKAIAEAVKWYTNAAMNISSFRTESIAITLTSSLQSLPFKPSTSCAGSTLHTILSLIPKSLVSTTCGVLIDTADVDGAQALIFDPKSQWPSEASRRARRFTCARMVLHPDSLSLALDATTDQLLHITESIEFLASRHQLRKSFDALQRRRPNLPKDLINTHVAIIWCHAGKHQRTKKILHQARSLCTSWFGCFWLTRFYTALSHYHLHQFNEGLEVMQVITDEVLLWSSTRYPIGFRHHGKARLFHIYASLLAGVDRLPEALDAAKEAIKSYRWMVSWGPGFGPFLAQSLETYAQILDRYKTSSGVESPITATKRDSNPNPINVNVLDVWNEAVDVWRGLAEKDEFFSMGFVDAMEVFQEKRGKVGRIEDYEKICEEIGQWRERAEKVRREKDKDIEELEKAWKATYPDWTDDTDDDEDFFSADEGDDVEDVQEFFSADEAE